MNRPEHMRALIIEDVDDDAVLLVNALRRAGIEVTYKRVESVEQLTSALQEDWDIVYSDYTLPGFDGMKALDIVRTHNRDVPFIFVSGTLGEERAVEAVKAGANDYIIKGSYTRLPIATERVLEEAEIRRENRLAKAHIDQLLNVDALTALASRGVFLETLHRTIEEARHTNCKVGVASVNVDRFRLINDTFGMKGGDQLIMDLAYRLKKAVSSCCLVARLYADQFAVVVPDIEKDEEFELVAKEIAACFEEPFPVHRYMKKVTGSIGLALFPDDGDQVQTLLNNVNLAQKLAKQKKGNSLLRYSRDARKTIDSRLQLEAELESAIRNHEFVLHFQPQVNTATGRVVGAESLVRWIHPEKGMISPLEFIPIAEETGLILPLGELICHLGCQQIRDWKRAGLPPIPVAINLSSQQFQHPGFAKMLEKIMAIYGVEPERLELEITETALINDPELAQSTMSELRSLGLKIALDDFGTGYSSMSYLDRFPIDIIKIDRAFISNFPGDSRKVAIVNAIISIADKLHMRVIAEGVETLEQLGFLRALGCEVAQGFYIHRPVEAADVLPALLGGVLPLSRADESPRLLQ